MGRSLENVLGKFWKCGFRSCYCRYDMVRVFMCMGVSKAVS